MYQGFDASTVSLAFYVIGPRKNAKYSHNMTCLLLGFHLLHPGVLRFTVRSLRAFK